MSEPTPIIAPTPHPASATLAPPDSAHTRPSSSQSNRSGSSRGRKSPSSSNISRSNSRSSRNSDNGDKVKKSGTTTTISGGVKLSIASDANDGKKGRGGKRPGSATGNSGNAERKDAAAPGASANAAAGGDKAKGNRRASANQKARPAPINTAPPKATSQASNAKSPSENSQSAPVPKHLHAAPSAPKTALEAAAAVAKLREHENGGTGQKDAESGDGALANLQKMISSLKAVTKSGSTSSGSQPGSRSASGAKEPISGGSKGDPPASSPLPIPGSSSSSSTKKLKADAPSFTPSFSSVSPVASQAPISPVGATSPQWAQQQPRSVSHGSAGHRRPSSSSQHGQSASQSLHSYSSMPTLSQTGLGMFSNSVPNYGAYPGQLHVHQEAENEDLSPLAYSPHPEAAFQYQQLLAAQALQYQQIQLLQAQLQYAHHQQQQQQQQQAHQQTSGSFVAPRFQALAAQRAAQQQQQAAAQLIQAQQAFEMQQQQLVELQRQKEAQAAAVAEATLRNPPPVFEEDSPEIRPASLGPTGRPQLAPSFTFGAKRNTVESSPSGRSPMSPPPVINRSEGIGGAQATGLAGLAARAHKRTGSELTPAMQAQLEIQEQIEALQAKQRALMEDEVSKVGGTPLSQLAKMTPSQTVARHRRVQSSLPSASTPGETFGGLLADLPNVDPPRPGRPAGEMLPPPVPVNAGHGRRHSVNVFNKTAGSGSGFGSMGAGDIPENSVPSNGGGGHQRSGSRSGFESGSWRSSGQLAQGPAQVADLAAAQAQLQSLSQFRAAAGGGHSKMASFSFPNMLPNLLAATTLSSPMGQSLWQQQQAFQMQLQQTTSGPQRKSLFAPYLPQASLPPLLSAGKLVVGILRVNKKNRSDAYVATDVLEADIYICGSKDRNRALEGDIVAVELLDVDEVWSTKKDKEEKKRKKEENAAYDLKPATAKKLEKKKDDVEVEGQGLTLFDDEEVNDDTKPTYAGHVVAVVERMPGQLFSGQLGVLRPSSAATKEKQEIERREREGDRPKKDETASSAERPKIVWFKPTDKRVPLIAIPTEQAPADFIDNPDAHADKLFVATIKRWPITSLHPFGTLVEELGPIGNCEVETSALLKDCNFPTEEFTDVALKCLPPLPWSIPEREYEIRKDLREECVFTIDPPKAKDLDDALSIKEQEDGTIRVGVHIADVSYFVKPNTALDRDARKRATSVYLVQRAVPMLPPQLSEDLCSLQPHQERLTFSAFFTLDKDANVLSTDFSRTIIKSCARLSYADAKAVLDGTPLSHDKVEGHPQSVVESGIKDLHAIASKLRQKRIDNGAMISHKLKVNISLDERGQPVDCDSYQRTEANTLVEEFMLLANLAVARQIAFGLPEQALLRRHEAPIERRIEGFVKRAQKLGYQFDGASAKTLQEGFSAIKDADAALCLELLKRKAMQKARYFCTGMLDIAKYSHWALNAPLYTHFTSPSRRYADVLVHRMLDACLTSPNPADVKFLMDRDQVAKCAQQCNMKKQSAKLAEDQSTHLYLCMLIHDLTEKYGPVVREGRVTNVLDAAFDVVVPEFGIEKRVHVDKIPVDNTVYDEHKDILSLYWTEKDVLAYLAETTDDAYIKAVKLLQDRPRSDLSTEGLTAQYAKSANPPQMEFEGLRDSGDHKIQDVKELMKVPVIVMSDMTKSPPVLVVYAANPYAK